MPIPTFSNITSSLDDDRTGAFRARKDTGKAGVKFNTKAANGFKFEADGSFPGKAAFSFTYPKLGYKKFTGDLKVKGTVKGDKDSYKIQYKKINLKKVGSLDLTFDLKANTVEADLTSKQDKFTLVANAKYGKSKAGDSTCTDITGSVSAVVGDGDTNFGVELPFDLKSTDEAAAVAGDGEAMARMAGPVGFPSFAAAYRPAAGTELFFKSTGNVPFNPSGPALEIDLGATSVVDDNNTVSFQYGLNCESNKLNGRGASVAGTRKIGADTMEYLIAADGAFSGSYSTSLADRLTGKLHFANKIGDLSLNNTAFGYSVEFA